MSTETIESRVTHARIALKPDGSFGKSPEMSEFGLHVCSADLKSDASVDDVIYPIHDLCIMHRCLVSKHTPNLVTVG